MSNPAMRGDASRSYRTAPKVGQSIGNVLYRQHLEYHRIVLQDYDGSSADVFGGSVVNTCLESFVGYAQKLIRIPESCVIQYYLFLFLFE